MADDTTGDRTAGAQKEHLEQQQEQRHVDARRDMGTAEMSEAIEHEHDQKVTPGNESRYEDRVDDAIEGR